MNISFFSCKSRAERSFRLFLCTVALVALLICTCKSAGLMPANDTLRLLVLQSAFATDRISESEAYRFRDMLIGESCVHTEAAFTRPPSDR